LQVFFAHLPDGDFARSGGRYLHLGPIVTQLALGLGKIGGF
jgi:hypothetical protein